MPSLRTKAHGSIIFQEPILPVDVFSVVTDIIASDLDSAPYVRLRSLMALSLTCYPLFFLSQRYMFTTVNFRLFPRPPFTNPQPQYEIPAIGLQELERVLNRNPCVANYVRTLNIQLDEDDSTGDLVGDIGLLHRFTRLETLTMTPHENVHYTHGVPRWWDEGDIELNRDGEGDLGLLVDDATFMERYQSRPINWEAIPQDLQDAFQILLGLPKLSTLKLLHIKYFPSEILALAVNLQTLHVDRCEFTFVSSPVSSAALLPAGKVRMPLRRFKIHPGTRSDVRILNSSVQYGYGDVPVVDFAQLRQIIFMFRRSFVVDELHQLGDLLDCALHVETLTLFYRYWFPRPLPSGFQPRVQEETFRKLARLHNLRIICDLPVRFYYCSILCDTLKDAKSFEVLESLDIRIKLYPGLTEPIVRELQNLDYYISSVSRFPALTSVTIAIFLDHFSDFKETSVLQSFGSPRLRASASDLYELSDILLWLRLPNTHLSFLSSGVVDLSYSVMDAVGALNPTIIVNNALGILNESYMYLCD
ncbi:hypothetical protein GALMADRAFT_147535 [Galerina marginata CBS 339.88]|uniref:F-box domain-containing protein n=1 Tax=Galerina marginata (strain CBS 339.88) TaxID=685588 RepID=A0A067S7P7_GALM3|nr:hypothetical protein GALMADRAFT_147535 [Galerina marginata CBS 339.88]